MRVVVMLLLLLTLGSGGAIWHGLGMIKQRDATIASMNSLVDRMKEEAGPATREDADGRDQRLAEIVAENNALHDEIAALRSRSDAAEADLSGAEQRASVSVETLRSRLEEVGQERDRAVEGAAAAEQRVEILEDELRQALAGMIDPSIAQTDVGELQVEVTMLRHERDAARAQIDLLLRENAEIQGRSLQEEGTIPIDEHNAEIDGMVRQIELLETDLGEARGRYALLEDELARLRASEDREAEAALTENAEISASLAAANASNARLEAANETLNQQVSALEAALVDREQEIAELERASLEAAPDTGLIDEMTERNADLMQQVASLEERNTSLTEERDRMEAQLAQSNQAQDETIETIRKSLKEEQARNQSLEKQIGVIIAARDKAWKELSDVRSTSGNLFTADELQTATSEAVRAIETRYQEEMAEIQERVAEIETKNAEIAGERTAALGKITALQQQVERLQAERETFVKASEEALNAADAESDQIRDNYETRIMEQRERSEALARQIEELTGELNLARAEITRLRASQDDTESRQQLADDLAAIKPVDEPETAGEDATEISDTDSELARELEELRERNRELERFVTINTPEPPVMAPREE